MTAADFLINAAAHIEASDDEARVAAVVRLVEEAQKEFDKSAARMAITSRDLDRAYSL